MARYSYWSESAKPRVERWLRDAGVSGEAARHILRFERAICTCRNALDRGASFEAVYYSTAYERACDLLYALNGGGMCYGDERFGDEWRRYCAAAGTCHRADMQDHLA